MKENHLITNVNPSLDEELATDGTTFIYPELENDNEIDSPPQIFDSADFCGSSTENSMKIDACEISNNKNIQAELDCQGRLLSIKVTLKNVCTNKYISIGVLLLEGTTVRGFKAKEILTPPLLTGHSCNHCENYVVCKFCFVLPGSVCCPITLTPKVIAHYTNFNVDIC